MNEVCFYTYLQILNSEEALDARNLPLPLKHAEDLLLRLKLLSVTVDKI